METSFQQIFFTANIEIIKHDHRCELSKAGHGNFLRRHIADQISAFTDADSSNGRVQISIKAKPWQKYWLLDNRKASSRGVMWA